MYVCTCVYFRALLRSPYQWNIYINWYSSLYYRMTHILFFLLLVVSFSVPFSSWNFETQFNNCTYQWHVWGQFVILFSITVETILSVPDYYNPYIPLTSKCLSLSCIFGYCFNLVPVQYLFQYVWILNLGGFHIYFSGLCTL